jgi:hypothetical protein
VRIIPDSNDSGSMMLTAIPLLLLMRKYERVVAAAGIEGARLACACWQAPGEQESSDEAIGMAR